MAKKFHLAWGSVAAVCLVGVYACGDSDGGANASTNAETAALDEVYASEDDLPGCTEKYDGAVAFVKEGSTAFKCEDGRWENKGEYYANNDAIKNCTAKREGEVAYIVDEDKSLVCEDGKWVNSSNVSSSSSWTPEGGIGSSSSKVPEPVEGTSSSDVSSSSVVSSSSSVTPQSSSSETSVSSNSTKSSSSVAQSSSSVASSSSAKSSSSSVKSSLSITSSSSSGIVLPCKTESEDNCEYGILKDSRDGQEYKTVKIGEQWWMAENLNYKVDSSYCFFVSQDSCAITKYGRVYTWAAAVNESEERCGQNTMCELPEPVQGVCPKGWHLPNETEWRFLINMTIGKLLKTQAGWNVYDNGDDSFGFSVLPAPRKISAFNSDKSDADFWSSSEVRGVAIRMNINARYDFATMTNYDKSSALSIRCIKD